MKAKQDRAEATVKRAVRAACVERDAICSVESAFFGHRGYPWEIRDETRLIGWDEGCQGKSEWAHMHQKRRSQTRGQAPDVRHTTADSLMLCRFHHQEYDAHRLKITALTRRGADGALKFTRAR